MLRKHYLHKRVLLGEEVFVEYVEFCQMGHTSPNRRSQGINVAYMVGATSLIIFFYDLTINSDRSKNWCKISLVRVLFCTSNFNSFFFVLFLFIAQPFRTSFFQQTDGSTSGPVQGDSGGVRSYSMLHSICCHSQVPLESLFCRKQCKVPQKQKKVLTWKFWIRMICWIKVY